MIGQGFVEVVSDVPSQGEAVGYHLHEPPLASEVLEEKDKLKLEEDHRVNRVPTAPGL